MGASRHILLDLAYRIAENHVTGRAGYGVQRFNQWYASSEGRCQSARITGDGRFVEDGADDRNSEYSPINAIAEFLGASVCFAERKSGRKEGDQNDEPPLLQHFGKVDDHHGEGWQLCTKGGEHGLELGDHLDQQDR
ncbi:hypothetical protein D9M71_384540 [compost metagenome]